MNGASSLSNRCRRRAWLEAALLVLLPALWWWPLLAGQLPDFMDTVTQLYPMRVEAANQIRAGVLPLWSPAIFSGTPLAANPQIAVWYPPHLPFWLWPSPLTYGLIMIGHIVFGGFGMRALVRRLTPSRGAALFAAVGFQFGSLMVARMALTPHLESAAWLPWILCAAHDAQRTARLRGTWWPVRSAALLAVFGACMFLAGAPQVCYYAALLLPVWLTAQAAGDVRAGRARAVARALVQGAWAAVLAGLLVGMQLLPTLEFLHHTARGAIDLGRLREQALNGSMLWRALVGFTHGGLEDTDSINAIGVGLLLLVPLALLRRRHRIRVLGLLAVLALGLALAAGALVPLWARALPLYETFHAPRRALLIWSAVGPAAAGLGAGALAVWWRRRRWPRAAYGALLAVLLIPNALLLPRLERVFCQPDHLLPDPRVAAAIGAERFLTVDPTLNFAYDSRRADYGHSLLPDLACWHGLRDAQGYDPLVLARYARLRDLACARSGIMFPSHGVFFTDPAAPLLRLLGVRWLVGRWDLFDPGRVIPGAGFDRERLASLLRLAVDDPRWPLWEFTDPRPPAWMPQRVIAAPDADAALLGAARAAATDPFAIAFTEVELALPAARGTDAPAGSVTYARPSARTMQLGIERRVAPALICVAENWMPGWRASTDAGPAEVLPANGFQIGVIAPAGATTIRLHYMPLSFFRGLILTLAGALLTLAVWRGGRAPKRPSPAA